MVIPTGLRAARAIDRVPLDVGQSVSLAGTRIGVVNEHQGDDPDRGDDSGTEPELDLAEPSDLSDLWG